MSLDYTSLPLDVDMEKEESLVTNHTLKRGITAFLAPRLFE